MKRKAQCCCGELALEVTGEPEQYGMCHCDNCKQRTGSAFGLSAYFKKENIQKPTDRASCYKLKNPNDGSDQERYFCSKCGSTVYWLVSILPGFIGVAGGCFTQKPLEQPSYSTSHANMCSWLSVPESVKKNQ